MQDILSFLGGMFGTRAIELIAATCGFANVVLVLLTDGRANVGLKADRSGVDTEVKQLAHAVAATGIRSLVIDTQRSFLSQGNATQLARALAGDYLYLPNAQGTAIAAAARQVASA
jgi:magnesium chelatase subunit D